jgi:hypothetical protein
MLIGSSEETQHVAARLVIHTLAVVRKTIAVTVFWWGVGVLLSRGTRIADVYRGLALASAVTTAGIVLRQGLYAGTGWDPGPFNLSGVLPQSGWISYVGKVDIMKVWWAAVAGRGLALAWNKPPAFAQTLAIATTFLWLSSIWHDH